MSTSKLDCDLCPFRIQCEFDDMKSYLVYDDLKDYQECFDQLREDITDISNVFEIGGNNGNKTI